ncbi:uncharacterized protein [Triticum aestivum]|nr:uncharacterized protein LOC123093401 [Triticum aestivum]
MMEPHFFTGCSKLGADALDPLYFLTTTYVLDVKLIVSKMASDEDSLDDQNPRSWTVSNTSAINKTEEASSTVQDHHPQKAVVNFLKDENTTKTIHEQWQAKAKVAS